MATITRELEKRILNYMWFLGIIPVCSLKLALGWVIIIMQKIHSIILISCSRTAFRILKDDDLLVSQRYKLDETNHALLLNDECGESIPSPPNRSSMVQEFYGEFSNLSDLPTYEALWEENSKTGHSAWHALVIIYICSHFFMNRY